MEIVKNLHKYWKCWKSIKFPTFPIISNKFPKKTLIFQIFPIFSRFCQFLNLRPSTNTKNAKTLEIPPALWASGGLDHWCQPFNPFSPYILSVFQSFSPSILSIIQSINHSNSQIQSINHSNSQNINHKKPGRVYPSPLPPSQTSKPHYRTVYQAPNWIFVRNLFGVHISHLILINLEPLSSPLGDPV